MLNITTPRITNSIKFFRSFATSEQTYTARSRIKHYVVSRDQFSNEASILEEIMKVVNASKDSIVFLTQKSRVVATKYLDSNHVGRPASAEEIRNTLKSASVKNLLQGQHIIPLFRPDPGHVCLTLTDELGNPEELNTVSLRPNNKRKIASGVADLYQPLYGDFGGHLYYSQHTTFRAEAEKLAKTVAHVNSTTVADITIVPFSSSLLSRNQLMLNITKAKSSPVYNL